MQKTWRCFGENKKKNKHWTRLLLEIVTVRRIHSPLNWLKTPCSQWTSSGCRSHSNNYSSQRCLIKKRRAAASLSERHCQPALLTHPGPHYRFYFYFTIVQPSDHSASGLGANPSEPLPYGGFSLALRSSLSGNTASGARADWSWNSI